MTTGHPHRRHHHRASRQRQLLRRVVRRAAALAALLVTVTAPPVVLLFAAGSPLNPPAALRTRDVFTSPVDDHTVLWLVCAVGWLAYTHLLASLLTELLRQTRGVSWQVPFDRLLFGANTALAGHLVAGLLLTGTPDTATTAATAPAMLHAALTTPVLTAAATVPDLVTPEQPTRDRLSGATDKRSDGTSAEALPECRVLPPDGRDHDTLWDIAERHLGDGMRWREIFALNENRLMPDGQRLTKASLIHPGWILRLPADATTLDIDRVPAAPSTSRAPAAAQPPATVSPTLPTRPEVTSPGAQQDGVVVPPRVDRDAPDRPSEAVAVTPVGPAPTLEPSRPMAPAERPARQAAAEAAASTAASPPATGPGAAAPASDAPHPEAIAPTADHDSQVAAAVLGALALASLSLLGALTRRRKVAARRRPLGARTQRPSPELLAEEQRIRHEARLAETTTATIRLALHLANPHSGRTELKALWQHPDCSLELLWTHPQAAPAPIPFETTDRGWLLPASAQPLLFATRRPATTGRTASSPPVGTTSSEAQPNAGVVDPVPLLMPVGHQEGSALLVNLELYGTVTLTSSAPASSTNGSSEESVGQAVADSKADNNADSDTGPTVPLEVLTAWIHSLASAPWSTGVHTHVPSDLADLATGFERVSVTDRITPAITLSTDEQRQIAEAGSLAAARHTNPDLHHEDLTVYAGYPAQLIPTDLLDGASSRQLPVLLLLLATQAEAGPETDSEALVGAGWTLDETGLLTIPGLAAGITPLRTSHEAHQRILRLLEHAQDPPLAAPDDPELAALRRQCPPDPTALAEPPSVAVIDLTAHDRPTATPSQPSAPRADEQASVSMSSDATRPGASATTEDALSTHTHTAPADPANGKKSAGKSASVAPRSSTGPVEINILGPLTLDGLDSDPPRRITTDLLLYYAFHRRPVSSQELWNGLFPSKPYQDTTLRGRRSELRRLIHPLLRKVGQKDVLDDLARTDWQRFQALADGNPDQQLAALRLIRGRPFDNCQMDWMSLEGHLTEIEAAITDLAIQVASRALIANDHATAREAAAAGRLGVPYDERLYRLGMQAAAAVGATGEVQLLRQQLNAVLLDELDPDDEMQPATAALLQHLADEQQRGQLQRRLGTAKDS